MSTFFKPRARYFRMNLKSHSGAAATSPHGAPSFRDSICMSISTWMANRRRLRENEFHNPRLTASQFRDRDARSVTNDPQA
jgi:hypothetical protein